ncbi:MAG TPA: hypothetical protein VG756_08615 [Pseudonocardiaceae bacterium]|nr:hypothetical protein [Pseudonocardiaceae bacterium]
MRTPRPVRPLLRFARRVGLVPSTLRRPVDRLENLFLAVAVLLAVAAIPGAVAAGQAAYRAGLATAATQTAQRTPIGAVLLENAPSVALTPEATSDTPVRARWQLPNGWVHTGPVPAKAGDTAGTAELIWVDARGHPVAAPLTANQAAGRGITTTVLTEFSVLLLLAALLSLLRWRLNVVRRRSWTTEWRRIGPQWTDHPRI